jgi:hypothetical protein
VKTLIQPHSSNRCAAHSTALPLRWVLACTLACALALQAAPALAQVGVRFVEGAPKDRFEFTNRSACALANTEITLDLSTSPAGLIFDTTSQRGITIAGSEIAGATVRVAAGGFSASGRFSSQAETTVAVPPCR